MANALASTLLSVYQSGTLLSTAVNVLFILVVAAAMRVIYMRSYVYIYERVNYPVYPLQKEYYLRERSNN